MNPTTLAWQLQLEEYAIFKTEGQDGFAQNFRFRGIIPLKEGFLIKVPQLIRVITFLNTAPDGKTGLGDLTLNRFFLLTKKGWGEFGAGWNIQIPTRTDDQLGSPQWSIGPAFTVIFTDLGKWQMYWIWKIFSPYLEMTRMVLPLMPACSQMSSIDGQMGFMLGLNPNGRSTIRLEKLYRWISGLDIYGRAN
ncbi:transporter [Flavobacterium ginsenosidimutans]|uniref:transporter n=1 Tax=Flavobacterium ginsenosidimutans TaxID=687844 RepID=UPI0013A62FB4|nr:transporter [Flavobacterium ginsenosidimutans]KAF2326699.1 transporter [Flavobacterium ginsenosidimutans]